MDSMGSMDMVGNSMDVDMGVGRMLVQVDHQ